MWNAEVQEQIVRVDHVALAVKNLKKSLTFYVEVLGAEVLDEMETRGESTGMVSAVVRLGGATLVLVQGTEPESQVSRFVTEFGPGVQHIAVEVKDLEKVANIYRERGAQFETPVIEGPFTRQIFTIRDEDAAVRIELIERGGHGFSNKPVEELFRHMEVKGAV